jgi:membrane-bound lytic murein transglycosylase D
MCATRVRAADRSGDGNGLSALLPSASLGMLSLVLTCLALVFLLGLPHHALGQAFQKKAAPTTDKRLADIEKEVTRLRAETDVYTTEYLTDSLTLCGKKIPLARDDTRERFEREFFQLLENKGLLMVIVKRCLKYYPMINAEIQRMGLPQDLIYLVITESYLNPRAVSRASAAGLWQFMKETGKREGLSVNDYIDERYNIKKATRSGLAHLKRLHNEFGDWLIAMAAYNAGAGRLREATENQETTDFFDLYLPEETERYIFRIAAIKEIIIDRERFGIYVDDKTIYKPVSVAEVHVELDQETHVNVFSKCMDVSYRTFRNLNLHLRKYRMPKGSYTIIVPADKKDVFLKKLKNYPSIRVTQEG